MKNGDIQHMKYKYGDKVVISSEMGEFWQGATGYIVGYNLVKGMVVYEVLLDHNEKINAMEEHVSSKKRTAK